MRVLLSAVAILAMASGSKINTMKETIQAKATSDSRLMAQMGTVGPFKMINKDIIAKVSKVGKPFDLPASKQRGAWNPVEGNSMIEAWSVGERGLVIKQKQSTVPCLTSKGLDNSANVAITFTCMLEGQAVLHKPMWPIKTGYDALHDQTPLQNAPFDDKDKSADWDPRVRFWHRCAGGSNNGLSLCNRYRYIGADAQGYYGCDYMTQDSYCVQSYRHEWMEFNPNDLPFVFSPPSPCDKQPCAKDQAVMEN